MIVTTKVLKVKLPDKFKLRRGQHFKTQFPDAIHLHELKCNDQTKLSRHSQNTYKKLFVTMALKWLLQMQSSQKVLA